MTDQNSKVSALQKLIKSILPLLDHNLSLAHSEYMNGQIAKGAFDYVLQRSGTASILAEHKRIANIAPAMSAFAPCFIDLRAGLKEYSGDRRDTYETCIEELSTFYSENGFTKKHGLFDFPAPDHSVQTDVPLFHDDTKSLLKPFKGLNTRSEVTVVRPYDGEPPYVQVDGSPSQIAVMDVEAAIQKDLLEDDTWSGGAPLSASYATYKFTQKTYSLVAGKKAA